MLYLIIPVVCFVLLAWLFWLAFAPRAREKTWTGKIDELDLVLSVLMTAGLDEPYLRLKVPRRVTWVRMTFPGSLVRLEIPLVTRLQQSRKERYLEFLRGLELEPQILSDGGDHDTLKCDVDGPPTRAATVIKDAFVRLFEVDPARELEFCAFANSWDQHVIDHALQVNRPGSDGALPVAATQGREVDPSAETRAGCMTALVGFLLLPVPFMIAHLELGYIAASAVLVVILVVWEVHRRWKRSGAGFGLGDFLKITVLSLTGTTIYLSDPLYLQLIPTIFVSVIAVAEVLSISFNLPRLSIYDAKSEEFEMPGRLLMSLAIIGTCIGAATMNEYLRTNVSLDAWMWFFAFFRIEFIFGLLTTSMPFFLYISIRQLKRDGDL